MDGDNVTPFPSRGPRAAGLVAQDAAALVLLDIVRRACPRQSDDFAAQEAIVLGAAISRLLAVAPIEDLPGAVEDALVVRARFLAALAGRQLAELDPIRRASAIPSTVNTLASATLPSRAEEPTPA
jgi:hypothetical protein